jgi:hypothetical protein
VKSDPDIPLNLHSRLSLRPKEAAEALGVSERHLRNMLPDIPHLYLGNRLVIPVKPFEEWLREQAEKGHTQADQSTTGATVQSILCSLDNSS